MWDVAILPRSAMRSVGEALEALEPSPKGPVPAGKHAIDSPNAPQAPVLKFGEWLDYEVRKRADALRNPFSVGAIEHVTPAEFESVVAHALAQMGFVDVQVVGGAGDIGADIKARDPAGRIVIAQCKRYARHRKIASRDIQGLLGSIAHYGASLGFFATTSSFTRDAEVLAAAHDIELLDGLKLELLFATRPEYEEPSSRLLEAVEKEVLEETRKDLFVGRVVAKGSEGLVLRWKDYYFLVPPTEIRLSSFHQPPTLTGWRAASYRGDMRVCVDLDSPTVLWRGEKGTIECFQASRRESIDIERRDVRHRALTSLPIGQPQRAVVVHTAADGALVLFPDIDFVRGFLPLHLMHADERVFHVREFADPGVLLTAYPLLVDLDKQTIIASLFDPATTGELAALRLGEVPAATVEVGTAGDEVATADHVSPTPSRAPEPSSPSPANTSAAESQEVIDLLRQLGELRDKGVITDEEFDAKKAELLSRL